MHCESQLFLSVFDQVTLYSYTIDLVLNMQCVHTTTQCQQILHVQCVHTTTQHQKILHVQHVFIPPPDTNRCYTHNMCSYSHCMPTDTANDSCIHATTPNHQTQPGTPLLQIKMAAITDRSGFYIYILFLCKYSGLTIKNTHFNFILKFIFCFYWKQLFPLPIMQPDTPPSSSSLPIWVC